MSLRRRMSLVSAITVAVAICLASAIAYLVVRSELRSQVDDELRRGAQRVSGIASQAPDILRRRGAIAKALDRSGRSELTEGLPPPQPGFVAALGGPDFFVQLIPPDGTPVGPPGPPSVAAPLELPLDADAARIAATGE